MEKEFFWALSRLFGRNIPKKNALYRSPFRKDKKPSFSIFKYRGEWFFKDFSTGEVGTAVHLYMKIYNVSYTDALKVILGDNYDEKKEQLYTNIKLSTECPSYNETEIILSYSINHEYNFMEQIGIRKEILELNSVVSIKGGQYNNYKFTDEAILYRGIPSINPNVKPAQKLYFHNKKKDEKFRFLGNKKWHHIFGTNSFLGGSYCFIGAGEKDTLVLQSVFNVSAICFNSETYLPCEDMLVWLRQKEYEYRIVYDNDIVGKTFAEKLQSLFIKNGISSSICNIPEQYKDVTDMYIAEKQVSFL